MASINSYAFQFSNYYKKWVAPYQTKFCFLLLALQLLHDCLETLNLFLMFLLRESRVSNESVFPDLQSYKICKAQEVERERRRGREY